MSDNLNLDELVKIYLTIRSERERMMAEWKAKDREFENDLTALSQQMLVVCNETNATSIKTQEGRVVKKLNERYTVSDGDSFRKFVMENNAPELFEARISQGNFKQFIAERQGDGLPPGVNVMREFTIVVYKPTSD
jgi:hypothetical protein